jgi:hypothetical protein
VRYWESKFRPPAGFQVFDELEARVELDRRAGLLMRCRGGRFELNRPCQVALVESAKLSSATSLRHRGVMLLLDPETRRAGITVAPVECPPGKRILVTQFADPMVRTGLTAEWPLAVPAREFLEFHSLAAKEEDSAELVAGVLTFRVHVESELVFASSRRSS